MNKTARLILVLMTLLLQSKLTDAQNPLSYVHTDQTISDDSIEKIMLEKLRKFRMHKENKDSAWINDLNGNTVWDSRLKSKDGKSITITDSITNNYFVLDTTHIIITAFNKAKQLIWKTDPRKDASIPDYRHKNPKIRFFQLGELERNIYGSKNRKGERVLFISYTNSQFGFLDLKTGVFTYEGQD